LPKLTGGVAMAVAGRHVNRTLTVRIEHTRVLPGVAGLRRR
jgi:hypothetical protein